MVPLGRVREQVNQRVEVEQPCHRVSVLGADDVGALDGVAAEEDGEVEPDDVVVALHGVELDGEAARVAALVGELAAKGDVGEADEHGGLFADRGEEVGLGQGGDVFGALEVAEGAGAAWVVPCARAAWSG